ncbi:transmembrane protein, putative [Medicago truncatula]|uniref:Transmembrane protein, putative n=1 Tax=Medicago truncatula TaxID=3880 RepID=G7IR03_MEDTR|nr:transmembrane protein, putative [Medicago truncatula]
METMLKMLFKFMLFFFAIAGAMVANVQGLEPCCPNGPRLCGPPICLKPPCFANNGIEALPTDPIDAQRNSHIDGKNKGCKTLFHIHQCVDNNVFEKIVCANTLMEVWDTLVKYNDGDAKVNKPWL